MVEARAYSTKPSAVRMRRMRERRKRAQLELLATDRGLKQITWHCGCGAEIVVFDNERADFSAWLKHRHGCLFARDAFPIALQFQAPAPKGAA